MSGPPPPSSSIEERLVVFEERIDQRFKALEQIMVGVQHQMNKSVMQTFKPEASSLMAEALHKVENVGTFVDFLVWFAQTPKLLLK